MKRFKVLSLIALLGMIAVITVSALTDTKDVYADRVKPDFTEEMSAMPCNNIIQTKPLFTVKNLGTFRLTAYCSCHKCCGKWADGRPLDSNGNEIVMGAWGKPLTAGYSVAVDPTVIPYGSLLIINGNTYQAMDCGYGIDGACIDMYFTDHQEALNFGMQYADVSIILD